MTELIQKFTDFIDIIVAWFNNSLGQGVLEFTKSILLLIIDIFEFFIGIVQWILNHI